MYHVRETIDPAKIKTCQGSQLCLFEVILASELASGYFVAFLYIFGME